MKKILILVLMLLIAIVAPAQNTGKSGTTTSNTKTTTQTTSSTKGKTSNSAGTKSSSGTKSSTTTSSSASKPSSASNSSSASQTKSASGSGATASAQSGNGQAKQSTGSNQQKSGSSNQKKDNKDNDKKKKDFYDDLTLQATAGLGIDNSLALKTGIDARLPFILPHAYLLAGGRLALRTVSGESYGKIKTVYIEVPVNIGYTLPLGDNLAFFAQTGPYLGMKLFKVYSEYDHGRTCPRRFDIGWGIDGGIEVGHRLRFALGLDHGFIKPCVAEAHDRNKCFWVSASLLL
jgi:hypothetical protein